ncbi:Serine/threonine-protein kinase [Trichinella pseudospiralis]
MYLIENMAISLRMVHYKCSLESTHAFYLLCEFFLDNLIHSFNIACVKGMFFQLSLFLRQRAYHRQRLIFQRYEFAK